MNKVRWGPFPVRIETVRIGDVQLPCQVLYNDSWNVCWIRKECAEKAHRTKLDGVPQPVMSPSERRNRAMVAIVEEEVFGQLRG